MPRKDLERSALTMGKIKNPFRTKTTENIKTEYQGGGMFPENDGYAGTGVKTTFTDKKGRKRKEIIVSSISPENRKELGPGNYSEYGNESVANTTPYTRKRVKKFSKDYSYKTGLVKTKEVFNAPGDGWVKGTEKSKRKSFFGEETFKDGSKSKYKYKNKGTKELKKAAKLGEV